MTKLTEQSSQSINLPSEWKEHIGHLFEENYMKNLRHFLLKEYKTQIVYPPAKHVFRAFYETPFHLIKVVILGQDPYHGPGQAQGLSFSVSDDVPPPPSLQNIFKERADDLSLPPRKTHSLVSWAQEGVLLLNDVLTVRARCPASHQKQGWEPFTEAVLRIVAQKHKNLVFILWGSHAQAKASFLNPQDHLILKSPHPSPLSAYRGFFGSRPFSKTNNYLLRHGKKIINW